MGAAMTNGKDKLVAWLRDAHAMEEATADNLDRLEDGLKNLPQLAVQVRQHRDESRAQAARIQQSLRALGAGTSVIKDVATRMLARAEAYAAAVTDDDIVKNFLAAYAFESFEIASYIALQTAARSLDDEIFFQEPHRLDGQ